MPVYLIQACGPNDGSHDGVKAESVRNAILHEAFLDSRLKIE